MGLTKKQKKIGIINLIAHVIVYLAIALLIKLPILPLVVCGTLFSISTSIMYFNSNNNKEFIENLKKSFIRVFWFALYTAFFIILLPILGIPIILSAILWIAIGIIFGIIGYNYSNYMDKITAECNKLEDKEKRKGLINYFKYLINKNK